MYMLMLLKYILVFKHAKTVVFLFIYVHAVCVIEHTICGEVKTTVWQTSVGKCW